MIVLGYIVLAVAVVCAIYVFSWFAVMWNEGWF